MSSEAVIADGAQNRGNVDFADCDRDVGVAQCGGDIVADLHGEGIAAGTLGFGGCPGEGTGRAVDGAPGGTPCRSG